MVAKHASWVLLLAVLGAATVLLATSTYGPGLTPDSAYYLSAASSVRAGDGLVGTDNQLLVRFPPLLPWSLALLSFFGLDLLSAARLLNATSLFVAVGVTFHQVGRIVGLRVVTIAGALLAISCAPFIEWFTQLLSEPLFIALLACFASVFSHALSHDRPRALVLSALIAAALPMTRYVGVVAIPLAAVLLLLWDADCLARRLRRCVAFVAIAAAPLTVYLARNVILTGTLTGDLGQTAGPGNPAGDVARMFVALAASWAVSWEWIELLRPYSKSLWAMLLFWGAVVMFCGAVVRGLRLWWRTADSQAKGYVVFSGAWAVGYTLFVCFAAWRISSVVFDARFLAPLFLPCLVLISVAVAENVQQYGLIGSAAPPEGGARAARLLVVGFVGAFLVFQSVRATAMVRHKLAEGAGGYASREWEQSPFFQYISNNPPPAGAISNGPDAVFVASGVRSGRVPVAESGDEVAALQARWDAGEEVSVVWFDLIDWRPHLVTREQLSGMGRLRATHSEVDGAVYASRR